MGGDLKPILTVARDILASNKAGMHVNDIAEEAVRSNKNMGMTADVMAIKLSSALSAHLKLKTQKPVFARVLNKNGTKKLGMYRLKQSRAPQVFSNMEPPPVDTGYFGKAGELAVMSELLFWGYNVSQMTVDQGIDLVASKDCKYHHIQVKTAMPQAQADGSPKYQFTIKQSAFDANHNSTMWYVFVLRKKTGNDYAVLPSSDIHTQRNAGIIGGKDLSVKISVEDKGKKHIMNGKRDINMFINNFPLIV